MLPTKERTSARSGAFPLFFSINCYLKFILNVIFICFLIRWLTYWSRNGGGKEDTFLYIYALINLVAVFTMFARVVLIFASGLRASRSLFEELLDVVLRAPMSFFDSKFLEQ
jgi:ABC-type multidrug transport system fused ATPase/permease subunit